MGLEINKISRWTIKIILPLISMFALIFVFSQYRKIISIDGKIFIAERALSSADQKKGLGGRASLCQNCAMIFEFEKPGDYVFWMKDMRFKLDIIWIFNGKIAYIAKNASFETLQTIDPGVDADKVLEINAGLSEEAGFKAGDSVAIF